jgi:hypothetical protein
MKMIGQEAEAQDPHRDFDAGMRDGFQERLVIAVLKEHLTAGVATIDDVVTDSAHRSSRRPRHGAKLADAGLHVNKKHECPLFFVVTFPAVAMADRWRLIPGHIYQLPGRAQAWIAAFDRSEQMQPITFNIMLTDHKGDDETDQPATWDSKRRPARVPSRASHGERGTTCA